MSKRSCVDIDPDYEDVRDRQSKRQRVLEEDAKEITIRKIARIIQENFLWEVQNKEKEVALVNQRLHIARTMMDRLRACIVASYYGSPTQQNFNPTAKAPVQPPNIHPAVKCHLGKAPPTHTVTSSMVRGENTQEEASIEASASSGCNEKTQEIDIKLKLTPSPRKSQVSPNHPGSRSSRFKIKKKVIVGNVSKYISMDKRDDNDQSSHKWMVYVRGSKEEPHIHSFVKKILFFLHPSYRPNDLVETSQPPFHLTRRGWGEFPVRVQLHFHDTRNKPVDVIHLLKLDRTYTGLQTLGAETVVEIELEKDVVEQAHDRTVSKSRLNMMEDIVKNAHVTTKHEPLSPESKLTRKRSKSKELKTNMDDDSLDEQNATKKNRIDCGEAASYNEFFCEKSPTLKSALNPSEHTSKDSSRQSPKQQSGELLMSSPSKNIKNSLSRLSDMKVCQNAADKKQSPIQTICVNTDPILKAPTDSKLQNISLQLQTSPVKDKSGINSLHQLLSHNIREQTAVLESSGSINNPVFTCSQLTVHARSSPSCTIQVNPKTSAVTTLFSTSPVPGLGIDTSLSSKGMVKNPDPKHNLYIKCYDSEGKQLLVPYTCIKQLPVASTSPKATPSVPGQQMPIASANISSLSPSIMTPPPSELLKQSGSSTLPQLSMLASKSSMLTAQQSPLSSALPNIATPPSVCISSTKQNLILSSSSIGSLLKKSPVPKVGSEVASHGNTSESLKSTLVPTCVSNERNLLITPNALFIPSTTLSQEKSSSSSLGVPVVGHGSASEAGICTQPLPSSPRSELLVTSSTSIVVSPQQNNDVFKKPLKVTSRGLQSILKSNEEDVRLQNSVSPKAVSLLNPYCRLRTNQKSVAVVAPMSVASVRVGEAAANEDKKMNNNSKVVEHCAPQVSKIKQTFVKDSSCKKQKSSFITIDGTKSAFNYLTDSQSQRVISDQISTPTVSKTPLSVTTVFPGQSVSPCQPTNPIILIPVSLSNQGQESRSASTGVVSLLKNFQLKKSSQLLMNSTDGIASTKAQERVREEIKLDKRIIVVNKNKKGKEVPTPVEDLEPLRLHNYPDIRSLIRASIRKHPVVCQTADRNLHPYCARTQEEWLSWNIGKRRASEWQRCSFARKYIKKHLGETEIFKGTQLWTVRELMSWCRKHAYSPHFLEKPLHPSVDPWTETEAVYNSVTDSDELSEMITKMSEEISGSSSEDELDVIGFDLPEMNKKLDVSQDTVCESAEIVPLSEEAQYVQETAEKIGVKFKATELQSGIQGFPALDMIYSAMTSFASDLLQEAFSLKVVEDRYPDSVGVGDIYKALSSLDITDFLVNKKLGKPGYLKQTSR